MRWACFECNFLRCFACACDRFDATDGRIFLRISGLSSLRWDHKLILPTQAICILLCYNQTWEVQ